jgi:uncharacterized phage-like protein YoqJ
MILAATGHRPDKLGGYGAEVFARLTRLAEVYLACTVRCDRVISGMALGWDMAWALGALRASVPFTAAVPFEGQESRWPDASRQQYHAILKQAAEVVVVCDGGYAPAKMQTRNEWMVDHADGIVALWNGTSGGTGNCVRYAERVGRPVDNLWPAWGRA